MRLQCNVCNGTYNDFVGVYRYYHVCAKRVNPQTKVLEVIPNARNENADKNATATIVKDNKGRPKSERVDYKPKHDGAGAVPL